VCLRYGRELFHAQYVSNDWGVLLRHLVQRKDELHFRVAALVRQRNKETVLGAARAFALLQDGQNIL